MGHVEETGLNVKEARLKQVMLTEVGHVEETRLKQVMFKRLD